MFFIQEEFFMLPDKPGIAPALFDTTDTPRMLLKPCEPILISNKMIPALKVHGYDHIGRHQCNN
jgi:hypothetical protein